MRGSRVTSSMPSGRRRDAVEVAAEADVIDAGDPRDVVDVVDQHGERRLRKRGEQRVAPGREARRRPRAVGPRAQACGAPRRSRLHRLGARRDTGVEEAGVEVDVHHAAVPGDGAQLVVGEVAREVAERARAGVRRDDRHASRRRWRRRRCCRETCDRSTSMPRRFISRTTSRPKAVRPPVRVPSSPIDEPAHGVAVVPREREIARRRAHGDRAGGRASPRWRGRLRRR